MLRWRAASAAPSRRCSSGPSRKSSSSWKTHHSTISRLTLNSAACLSPAFFLLSYTTFPTTFSIIFAYFISFFSYFRDRLRRILLIATIFYLYKKLLSCLGSKSRLQSVDYNSYYVYALWRNLLLERAHVHVVGLSLRHRR